ncbi:MAG: DUF5666 domain-containing protein [Chloroflexi bacterium]|nr:DUF5666 domain-containing protein [Chloroflexota bacterium]
MRRIPFTFLLIVAAVLGLALGAGIGAWQQSQSAPRAALAQATSGASSAAGAGTRAAGTGAGTAATPGAAAGRATVGTVQAVEGNNLTVQTAQGASTKVVLANDTTISRFDSGSLADVTAGATVTVVGQQQGDTVTADSVQIGEVPATAFGAGGFSGQGGTSGSPAGTLAAGQGGAPAVGQSGAQRTRVTGKVASVTADGFTVTTSSGQTKVAVPAAATVEKYVQGGAADLKAGVRVLVTGDTGADGSVAARSIQIMPATQARSGG